MFKKMSKKNNIFKYLAISFFIIILDQVVKIYIYFNVEAGSLGEIQIIENLFTIHYITNPGIAFGVELPCKYGNFFITFLRIIIISIIIYNFLNLKNKKSNNKKLLGLSFIIGGAIGNTIDNIFYGFFLKNSHSNFTWFNGQVIDMFYINIYEGFIPKYIPIIGNSYFSIFPIFNMADLFITIGVFIIIYIKEK